MGNVDEKHWKGCSQPLILRAAFIFQPYVTAGCLFWSYCEAVMVMSKLKLVMPLILDETVRLIKA
jgi:hypothetical protein